jgi:hypothetical protein
LELSSCCELQLGVNGGWYWLDKYYVSEGGKQLQFLWHQFKLCLGSNEALHLARLLAILLSSEAFLFVAGAEHGGLFFVEAN